jgi:hypothetical protein
MLAALSASAPFTVVVHEFGHAIAAVLVGRRVYVVSIGRGATIASWRFGDLEILLARDLAHGFIQAFPKGPEARWRTTLYLAGGAIANLATAAMSTALLIDFPESQVGPTAQCLASVIVGFGLSNLIVASLSFVPHVIRWRDQRLDSDGKRLIALWRNPFTTPDYSPFHVAFRGARLMREGRWREAREHYVAAIDRAPDQPGFLGCLIHVIAREEGPTAAMACFVERRAAFEAAGREPSPQYGYAAGNVAWQALRTEDASWLETADELSAQALSMDPASAPLKATRGAVLIAKGEREAGAAKLTAALREIEDTADKAEFCDFLAKEARKQGEAAMGAGFEDLEAHLLARS